MIKILCIECRMISISRSLSETEPENNSHITNYTYKNRLVNNA